MNHALTRSMVIPEIVKLIAAKYHLNEMEALDKFYTSATGASYADDETGLYGQSALYVFGLFCMFSDCSVRSRTDNHITDSYNRF